MAIAKVRDGGNLAQGTGTSIAATVPAAGHAVGNLVLVYVGGRDGAPETPTCADSRGNTYTLIHGHLGSNSTGSVFASVLTTALVDADTITATFATTHDASSINTVEFSGATTTEDVASAGANGSSTTPSSGAITPIEAEVLLPGCCFVVGPTSDAFTEDADTDGGAGWTSLPRVGQAAANNTLNSAFKITTSAVAQTYNPTLGTSRAWNCSISALESSAVVSLRCLLGVGK